MQWFATTIWTLLLCARLCLASAEDGSASAPAMVTPAADAPAAAMANERAWWNHDAVVADLVLTDAQRAKMDELLHASLQQEDESRRKQRDANAKLEAALYKGDLQAAREAAPGLRAALGEAWECKSTLMLDVLSVLNGEQRQKLLARHPELLRQPWEDRPTPSRRARAVLPRRSLPAR